MESLEPYIQQRDFLSWDNNNDDKLYIIASFAFTVYIQHKGSAVSRQDFVYLCTICDYWKPVFLNINIDCQSEKKTTPILAAPED